MPREAAFHEFCSKVSIIGLMTASDPGVPIIRRVTWMLLITTGSIISCFIVIQRIDVYANVPKSINIRLVEKEAVEFPAVTVCPMKLMGKQWLKNHADSNIISEYMNYLHALESFSLGSDNISSMPDVPYPLTRDEHQQFTQSVGYNLVKHCFIKNSRCAEEMLTPSITDRGGCITVNSGRGGVPRQRVYGIGIGQSLTLHLWRNETVIIDASNSFFDYGPDGFEIRIHDDAYVFSVRRDSITVSPGYEIRIALSKTRITMMDDGDEHACIETSAAAMPNYTIATCHLQCMARYVYSMCGCVILGLDVYDVGLPMCPSSAGWLCNEIYVSQFYTNAALEKSCHCLPLCAQNIYLMRISNAKISGTTATANDYSNIALVTTYFSSLTTESIEQQASYTFWSMMSDIGGALGLFVGSALFTVVEVIELLLILCVQRK